MTAYRRYAIYMVPTGGLYETGSAWLGWDSAAGRAIVHPHVPGLPLDASALTKAPRKYGIHGTLKPPFALAASADPLALAAALAAFCADHPPITIPAMALRRIGRFLALVPDAPAQSLADLAADTVRALDPFRAPPSAAEMSRRRKRGLTDRQEMLLQTWGYPYVMEEFRFHITLTGGIEPAHVARVEACLATLFEPHIGTALRIGDLALMGEDTEGRFHLLHRTPLTG